VKPSLASRRARVARVNAKRPRELAVEVAWVPEPGARDELVDLLLELLASRRHSGGR
jgi:hypothetical protein